VSIYFNSYKELTATVLRVTSVLMFDQSFYHFSTQVLNVSNDQNSKEAAKKYSFIDRSPLVFCGLCSYRL